MVTLPPTDTRQMSTAHMLRVVLQRVIDEQHVDDESRRLIYGLAGIAGLVDQVELVVPPGFVPKTSDPAPVRTKFGQVGEGYYMLDGMYVKVQQNQAGDRTYGKVWLSESESWSYEAAKDERVMSRLKPEHKLTAEQAAEFGALYGRCVFCAQQLNDERSIAVGYGETCASNHSLPWG